MSSDFITIIYQLPEKWKYQIVKVYRTCLKANFSGFLMCIRWTLFLDYIITMTGEMFK